MNPFRTESEAAYINARDWTDSPRRWQSEYGWLSGLSESTAQPQKPWYQALVESIGPTAAAVYMQRELNKLNVERTRQGLPPITSAEFSRSYQPPIARVEVDPGAQGRNLFLWAALGLSALVALRALKVV